VHESNFAEALAMAMEDRELGEWLAGERAFDSAFASALATVTIPESLRHEILSCMAAQRGDFPAAEDAGDAAMIGALASVNPPAGLREQILTAMESSRAVEVAGRSSHRIWGRLAIPLAAAAGIALAFLLTRQKISEPTQPSIALGGPVPVEVVQAGFIRTYQSPLYSFDETREDHQELIRHLRSRKLPCPGSSLPEGISNLKGVGCRELIIDGKRGSVVCFEECGKGVVHLVIFRREDICGELPCCDHPDFTQVGNWAAARWSDDKRVFVLIAATEVNKLAALF
jgi:hypothetical protein